jgi:hypothetical protein
MLNIGMKACYAAGSCSANTQIWDAKKLSPSSMHASAQFCKRNSAKVLSSLHKIGQVRRKMKNCSQSVKAEFQHSSPKAALQKGET